MTFLTYKKDRRKVKSNQIKILFSQMAYNNNNNNIPLICDLTNRKSLILFYTTHIITIKAVNTINAINTIKYRQCNQYNQYTQTKGHQIAVTDLTRAPQAADQVTPRPNAL